MKVSSKLCGIWSLISCTEPSYLRAELLVDYSNFKFKHAVDRFGPFQWNKNVFGSVYLTNTTNAKVIWSKKMVYSVECEFLPRIPIPWQTRCPRFSITYSLDASGDELTVVKGNDKYVFQKHYVSLENNDHFFKIFVTQLLFDLLLRNVQSDTLTLP